MSRMTRPSIEVAVATMNQSEPAALRGRLGLLGSDAELLIINQLDADAGAAGPGDPQAFEDGPQLSSGDGWRMLSCRERGLSRSRNRALDAARADIVLLADDDIHYVDGFTELVRTEFGRYPEAVAITFQFSADGSDRPHKAYRSQAAHHDRCSIAGISSIEVALRPALLQGVRFDERFGLGTEHPAGEEALFFDELLRRGAQAWYRPSLLCTHCGVSSGHRPWSKAQTRTKAAVTRRLFPHAWPVVLAGFALVKYPRFGSELGAPSWLFELVAGAVGAPR